jgi:hypothetical protein
MQNALINTRPDHAWMLSAGARVAANVVFRTFVQETVVLNLDTGRYHGLNPTAGRMLEEVERRETLGEAARRLADQYRQPLHEVERDLCDLCLALADRKLIEIDAPRPG